MAPHAAAWSACLLHLSSGVRLAMAILSPSMHLDSQMYQDLVALGSQNVSMP